MYSTGYNGKMRTLDELLAWSDWTNTDPEFARRLLAITDASIAAGRPLGFGGLHRTRAQQLALFKSRHHVVASGGCCSFDGFRWALNAGAAHAAPPDLSYHEPTTPDGKSMACDFTGDLTFLKEHAPAYGLVEFSGALREPWHAQPVGVPNGRSRYQAATMHPLAVWPLPGKPVAPTPPRPEVQPPSTEETTMIALDWKQNTPDYRAFCWTGVELSWIFNGHADKILRGAGVKRQPVNDDELLSVIQSSFTTTNPPPNLTPAMLAAWSQ